MSIITICGLVHCAFLYFVRSKFLFMNSSTNSDTLDEEVKELLRNYKFKKASTYEPCTQDNYKECLIGLSEEFGLLNIHFIFNPYIDIENNTITTRALITLINSVYTMLHYHKNVTEKADKLMEQNYILEQNNKQLNGLVTKLKDKVNLEKNESKACVASAQRISDHSDVMMKTLTITKAKLVQLTKHKEANERSLHNEVTRLKLDNEKLRDRLRSKGATPCTETCDTSLSQLKERMKKQQATITTLQKVNQDLLHKLINLKEDILLGGLDHLNLNDKK